MPSTTPWVTRNSQNWSARRNTTAKITTRNVTPKTRTAMVSVRLRSAVASTGGGGSTPAMGSEASGAFLTAGQKTKIPKRTRNGTAGVMLSWMGRRNARDSLHCGRNVLNSEMNTPRPRPPMSARGRLTSRPMAAAATATMTRPKKSGATRVLNRGAISTPARPAKKLDRAQEKADTLLASTRFSSAMRGLSTTARMRRPSAVNRNSAAMASMAVTAMHELGQLVATERVHPERVVEDVGASGQDAGGSPAGDGGEAEDQVEERGHGHGEPDGHDELGHRRRGAQVPEDEPLEDQPDQRSEDEHGDEQRGHGGPAPVVARLEVQRRRHVRLGTEGQVEHAGGLVGQDEPERDERVDRPRGQPLEDGPEEVLGRA